MGEVTLPTVSSVVVVSMQRGRRAERGNFLNKTGEEAVFGGCRDFIENGHRWR
jgi:hypothetical protein